MLNRPGTLREDLAAQREFVRSRAPSYARLIELIELEFDHGLEARLDEAWRGREFSAFYERPLLLLAALRDDALLEGETHPLWQGIAGSPPEPSTLTSSAVRRALRPDSERFWRIVRNRHVQTNETSRAVAWRWPARVAEEAHPGRPIALFDVGTSAGLNLVADHLTPTWSREDGAPLTVSPSGPVLARTGFDPRPLDVLDEDDARWLLACVWPGQGDREARLRDAIAAFRRLHAADAAPSLEIARAGEVPERLPRGSDDVLAIVAQTVVRDYIPGDEWGSYLGGMERWLAERPPGSALWIELEVTAAARTGGTPAAITAHVGTSRGALSLDLARCDPHPRQLAVDEHAVGALRSALAVAH